MSALVGKPVRLQFMRWDEHGWDNYGPAQMTDIRAGVDGGGNITAFEFTHFGIPYWTTPPAQQQVQRHDESRFATSTRRRAAPRRRSAARSTRSRTGG